MYQITQDLYTIYQREDEGALAKLKQVRAEGCEKLGNSPDYIYICYKNDVQFYLSEYLTGFEVFRLYKDGHLEKVLDTYHAKTFHAELKKRQRERRRKTCRRLFP